MSNERSYWIEHKRRKILVSDYSGLRGADLVAVITDNRDRLASIESGTLALIDVSDTLITQGVVEAFKEISRTGAAKAEKTAIVGVTGARRLILLAVTAFSKQEIRPFPSVDLAKDWLVE